MRKAENHRLCSPPPAVATSAYTLRALSLSRSTPSTLPVSSMCNAWHTWAHDEKPVLFKVHEGQKNLNPETTDPKLREAPREAAVRRPLLNSRGILLGDARVKHEPLLEEQILLRMPFNVTVYHTNILPWCKDAHVPVKLWVLQNCMPYHGDTKGTGTKIQKALAPISSTVQSGNLNLPGTILDTTSCLSLSE